MFNSNTLARQLEMDYFYPRILNKTVEKFRIL